MELRNLLSVKNPSNINETEKDEVYSTLIDVPIDDIPKKSLKSILQLSIVVLRYKGEKVDQLQREKEEILARHPTAIDRESDSITLHLEDENSKLKTLLGRLENEKTSQKIKIKELNEEIFNLQKRLQECMSQGSDREDSSDPLSELDKQEELMKNISSKNKHIKRLLADIEALERDNISLSKKVIELESKLHLKTAETTKLSDVLMNTEQENGHLKESMLKCNEEINRLEANITFLEEERERTDLEFKTFVEKLEERAFLWKKVLDEKENQLDSLRKKYETLYHQYPVAFAQQGEEREVSKLVEAMEERDCVIQELETKLKTMAEEMMQSTRLMNKLSVERESKEGETTAKSKSCCKKLEVSLEVANNRCKELAEMLEAAEEDNMNKARQATQAINALQAYQSGEDGLPQSLRKISSLQQKLGSRDKQIKALVMEINSLHEIVQENAILRKRLNIPDDVVISTNNLIAKQRSKDKAMERLNLKLRASEEMRLQLKLEKNEMRKEINELRLHIREGTEVGKTPKIEEPPKQPTVNPDFYCASCLKNIRNLPSKDETIKEIVKEWEDKYTAVVEENDNLRVGMHEILEKIREYDSSSEHITIDCSILEKLLHALDSRSISGWYHPAMRMQNELIAVKEREQALKEKINLVQKVTPVVAEKDVETVQPIELESHRSDDSDEEEVVVQILEEPNEDASLYPILILKDGELSNLREQFVEVQEKYRQSAIEVETLNIYKLKYEEMNEALKGSEDKITNYCSVLVEKITELEENLINDRKKYDFIKIDYDNCLKEAKNNNLSNSSVIASLKKEIIQYRTEINQMKSSTRSDRKEIDKFFDSKMISLKKDCAKSKMQLAEFMDQFYSGNVADFKVLSNEDLEKSVVVDIIKDSNMDVEYITINEFETIKNDRQKYFEKATESEVEIRSLKELLKVAQDQIKTQQKQLLEITDNQINLRHLVADLQSISEDKYLIAKLHRDLEMAKQETNFLKSENMELKITLKERNDQISEKLEEIEEINTNSEKSSKDKEIKMRFLIKSIFSLKEKYCKYMPLINLVDFVSLYTNYVESTKLTEQEVLIAKISKISENIIQAKVKASSLSDSEDVIKAVKLETKCKFLEDQINSDRQRITTLQNELDSLRLNFIENNEHWKTISALFGNADEPIKEFSNKHVQTVLDNKNVSTNTEDFLDEMDGDPSISEGGSEKSDSSKPETLQKSPIRMSEKSKQIQQQQEYLDKQISSPTKRSGVGAVCIKSLQSQLKQAMNLASMRSALLLETENRLAEAQGRIKEMEKIIEGKKQLLKLEIEKTSHSNEKSLKRSSGIVESTLSSLQMLLSEKDTTLSHYQELLKTEREQHSKSCENYEKEIVTLKKLVNELDSRIKAKELEINDLKSKSNNATSGANTIDSNGADLEFKNLDDNEENLNEISDEKIEEMFMDEQNQTFQDTEMELANQQIQQLQGQLREAKNRQVFWEKTLRSKEDEISLLTEKMFMLQEKEKPEMTTNPEIEQLRILLEDKDKHINDLMDTLTNFHEDQQRFINETTLYSADQVSQLGADLTRSEASNRILNTQIDALRRQLGTLTQREKQARDLANSLKTQLIKRPVISVKSELNARSKTEQMQKRINNLELEVDEARKEIKRQMNLADVKRAKNAADLSLWQKQKHWQQNAEKLKIKLQETETNLERTKAMLSTARTTIARLEKEKNILEMRQRSGKNCCRTPSCPNLVKYGTSDTPDSYGVTSDSSSPPSKRMIDVSDSNQELINAFKARVESLQRKIVSYELEGKGTNALTTELEKFQEKVSSVEAQNIRLEARNLQLQLDNDLLRQGDETERLRHRIKHLEDYILALKEELAEAKAYADTTTVRKGSTHQSINQMEQTIIALRRIVERLRVENKNLKDGRGHFDGMSQETKISDSQMEFSRLQFLYTEALDKISSLETEIKMKSSSCPNCNIDNQFDSNSNLMSELKLVKEKLAQKSQLLEKAKILLTRAAAKEKNLKDQITMWRRKCSELQNVPVIDEISE